MNNKQNMTKFVQGAAGAASSRTASNDVGPGVRRGLASGFAAEEPGVLAIWAAVRAQLRRQLSDSRFENWIGGLELIAEVNGDILISAPGELERDRVRSNYGHLIQQAWKQADPRRRAV